MLADEVGVNFFDFDIFDFSFISGEIDGKMGKNRKMLTGILGESIACSGVG
jgi:hypothetical protein